MSAEFGVLMHIGSLDPVGYKKLNIKNQEDGRLPF